MFGWHILGNGMQTYQRSISEISRVLFNCNKSKATKCQVDKGKKNWTKSPVSHHFLPSCISFYTYCRKQTNKMSDVNTILTWRLSNRVNVSMRSSWHTFTYLTLFARKLRNAVCIIDCISLLPWGSTRNLRQYNVFDNLSTLNVYRYLSTSETRPKNW